MVCTRLLGMFLHPGPRRGEVTWSDPRHPGQLQYPWAPSLTGAVKTPALLVPAAGRPTRKSERPSGPVCACFCICYPGHHPLTPSRLSQTLRAPQLRRCPPPSPKHTHTQRKSPRPWG